MTRLWAAVALLLALPHAGSAQTLREVLKEFDLPVVPGGPGDLEERITSYSAENWADLFVIAFYSPGAGPGALADTLRVSAFDRRTQHCSHVSLERRRTLAPAWDVGSVLGIQHSDGHLFLDTHSNPSAGTVIVLTRELRPVAALDGWVLKLLPTGRVFYHRSSPHFVATHPAELWAWDPQSGHDARIYPAQPYDSIRVHYIATIQRIYDRLGEAWFREHNVPMEAEHFGSSIRSRIRSDATGTAVVFLMQFGEDEEAPAPTPVLDVVVTCRSGGTDRARCREVELKTLQASHPGWSTTRILDDLIANLPGAAASP